MTPWGYAVAAAVLLSGCSTSSHGTQVSSRSPVSMSPVASPSPVSRQVLPPARSFPVVALCTQPLTADQYGNARPLLCTNGALNVLAWTAFADVAPGVMAAGHAASLQTVQAALCHDVNIGHAPVLDELSAYELSAAYYGWSFSTDPTDILYSMSRCPR